MISGTEFEQLWWDYETGKASLNDVVERLCSDDHKRELVKKYCREELAKFGALSERPLRRASDRI